MLLNMMNHQHTTTQIRKPVVRIEDRNRFYLDSDFVASYQSKQPAWNTLGYITYLRTYSRPIYDVNNQFVKNEDFHDTLQRVTEGTFTILKQKVFESGQFWDEHEAQAKAKEFFIRMWQFKWLPPGRGLWAMGTKYVEVNGGAALNNCGFVSTEHIHINFAEPFCTLMDYSMLGVGMGFDILGKDLVFIKEPIVGDEVHVVADTREGWVDLIGRILDSFVGATTYPGHIDYSLVRPEGSPIKSFGGTASGPGPLKDLASYITQTLNAQIGKFISGTIIVDIMNCIGRCVVAGNVRRSSEIAIADWADEEFVKLKDYSESNELRAQRDAIGAGNFKVELLHNEVKKLSALKNAFSVLHPEYLAYQMLIDDLEAQKKEIFSSIPEWLALDKQIQDLPLNHHRWASNNTILCDGISKEVLLERSAQIATNGEPGVGWMDIIRGYGRLADPINNKDHRVKGFNPCAEQSLEDRELCCLVETFPGKHHDLEDYLETLKFAYIYAKAVTCIMTHNAKTNAVISRNRRIGTSQAGIAAFYMQHGLQECIYWWDTGYKHVCELDRTYSGWMGIPESIKKTSVKPGGTIPLLVGEEGGMKWATAPYYMRTMRIDHMSPLIEKLVDAGYRVEKDRTTPRSMVVYFPMKSDASRFARDISIYEQMALFTALQAHWSDNMVSATITFRPEEKADIARVLDIYMGKIKCVSFLPYFDHGFVQAPYIPCSQEEYESALVKLKPINLNTQIKLHDTDEKYCDGDKCLI